MKLAMFKLMRATFAVALLSAALTAVATPLDDYIAKPDPAFTYSSPPARVVESPMHTINTYRMASQNWLDLTKVDRTLWEHWVVVIVPKQLASTKALLFIGGGSNRGTEPPNAEGALPQIAAMTKSIVVEIKQIPNQPLRVRDEHDDRYKERGRSEDELIAYCWDKFMSTGDANWLPRLPMTKAVVRAMDLVQKEQPTVDGFFVVGGSKRGWTTWTTAAVDKRVVGIAPAVIDLLNIVPSFDHHFAAYGFWAPAVKDYEDMNILARMHTPEFEALTKVVEPYHYRDRLTMPKYIVNSAGDQFFLPDSWKFYFDDLVGEKYLRYMPNTDHGLNAEAYFNLASFYHAVMSGTPRPKFTWKKAADGSLEVTCETKPTKVLLWQATNPEGRDFRLEKIGQAYMSTPLEDTGSGTYKSTVAAPEKGWTAFFIEVEFPNPGFVSPFKFTTGVSVLPDTYPVHEKK